MPSHAAGAVSGDEFAQVVTVLAEDFFVNRMRPVGFPAITPALSAARNRAHRELSHLTTERRSEADPDKPWNVRELLRETFEVLSAFGRHADPSKTAHGHIGANRARFTMRSTAGSFGLPGLRFTRPAPTIFIVLQ